MNRRGAVNINDLRLADQQRVSGQVQWAKWL
jgi:hypothetical protein